LRQCQVQGWGQVLVKLAVWGLPGWAPQAVGWGLLVTGWAHQAAVRGWAQLVLVVGWAQPGRGWARQVVGWAQPGKGWEQQVVGWARLGKGWARQVVGWALRVVWVMEMVVASSAVQDTRDVCKGQFLFHRG
jgi:hypothetical protein